MKDWRKDVPKRLLKKMIQKKLDPLYKRPTFLDTVAKQILAVSERSVCLFYDVSAAIFRNGHVLTTGYNGPSKGDVHCTDVGCARIVSGELKKGAGLCRGSHGELNSISNAAENGINIKGASMMLTFRPCYSCAKQLRNAGIKEIWYLFGYDGDDHVESYFRRLGINISRHTSEHLEEWIERNEYKPNNL
jgi:dCMP deaminase